MSTRPEEHVLLLKKKLARQLESGDDTGALAILDGLSRVQVSEELLRATKVGVFVGKLRKHENSRVADKARDVVAKWRRMVKRDEAAEKPARIDTSRTTPLRRSPSSGSASGPPSPGAGLRERTVTSDDVAYIRTGNAVRNKMIEMFYAALAKSSTADADRIMAKAVAVEEALFKQFTTPDTGYRARVRELYLNLKGDDNPALREAIVSGDLSPTRFCTMSSDDLMSEEQRQQELKINEENLFKARGAGQQEAATDAFKCPKCKQRKCTYFQMQTRSADEPMTTFVTCVVCNNRWKFC
ncbi:transcription elongation factor S-II [Thamnocephalis sphaerospora]|uniref:Transcription elongation factor n=1 Tax=Thamnocephalis sphaerospora TaxID=78915 RepID=A0A4P9XKH4_9FUNG|nr:transcription elongation factor S-II [Thamnocephalis sphaerospora]|eukprot:RKP06256.1 transcription elongation factor S-II [Thamnocephalis sphaerospora]